MLEEQYKMCFLRTDVNKLFWLTDFRRKLEIHELVDVWSEFFKCGVSHERIWLCYRSCMTGKKDIKGNFWFWMTDISSLKTLKERFRQFRNVRLWVWFSHPGFERLVSCLRWDMCLWMKAGLFEKFVLGTLVKIPASRCSTQKIKDNRSTIGHIHIIKIGLPNTVGFSFNCSPHCGWYVHSSRKFISYIIKSFSRQIISWIFVLDRFEYYL